MVIMRVVLVNFNELTTTVTRAAHRSMPYKISTGNNEKGERDRNSIYREREREKAAWFYLSLSRLDACGQTLLCLCISCVFVRPVQKGVHT